MEPIILQAENAELDKVYSTRTKTGFSGTGYVTGFTHYSGSVTFTISVATKQLFHLYVGYATPHGPKLTNLILNGKPTGDIALPEVSGFGEVLGGAVLLEEGVNTLSLSKGWGWYDLDYIRLELSQSFSRPTLPKTLTNPHSTQEARALFSFLVDQYGKRIVAGQQEYTGQPFSESDYIFNHTGKRPAIMGFDFVEYSPSRTKPEKKPKEVEHAIKWHAMGGIVSFSWHWNAPAGLGKNNEPWWRGFYTSATSFDIAHTLRNRGSKDYALLLRDMDAIAKELLLLQEAGVPVLFRPMHEAEGGWFWWGAQGPQATKSLWLLLYERLTKYHRINNLIWVWNSVDPAWYPGDDYVDVNSYDSYIGQKVYGPVANVFRQLEDLSRYKLIGLSENGAIPDPRLIEMYGAWWSFFVTWNGEILREWNDLDHIQHVYNHPLVLTLEDLPDLKNYPY